MSDCVPWTEKTKSTAELLNYNNRRNQGNSSGLISLTSLDKVIRISDQVNNRKSTTE